MEFFKKYGLPPETDEIELYNLKIDPNEKNNIAKRNLFIVKKFLPYIKNLKKIIEKNRTKYKNSNKKFDMI